MPAAEGVETQVQARHAGPAPHQKVHQALQRGGSLGPFRDVHAQAVAAGGILGRPRCGMPGLGGGRQRPLAASRASNACSCPGATAAAAPPQAWRRLPQATAVQHAQGPTLLCRQLQRACHAPRAPAGQQWRPGARAGRWTRAGRPSAWLERCWEPWTRARGRQRCRMGTKGDPGATMRVAHGSASGGGSAARPPPTVARVWAHLPGMPFSESRSLPDGTVEVEVKSRTVFIHQTKMGGQQYTQRRSDSTGEERESGRASSVGFRRCEWVRLAVLGRAAAAGRVLLAARDAPVRGCR